MTSFAGWDFFVMYFVAASPWLLAMLVGAVLCFRHASTQRRRATLVGVALMIEVGSLVLSLVGPRVLYSYVGSTGNSQFLQLTITLVVHFIPQAAVWLLMLYAVFYGDPRPVDRGDDDDLDA